MKIIACLYWYNLSNAVNAGMLDEGKQELVQTDTGNHWNKVSRPFSLVAPRGSLLSLVEGHLEGPGRRNCHFIACPLFMETLMIIHLMYLFYLEVSDKRRNPTVRLIVVFFVWQLLQLRKERDGVPRSEERQQVRR